eukprot:scaffold227716_cov17-Tisochrysis_lutea.AAC.2
MASPLRIPLLPICLNMPQFALLQTGHPPGIPSMQTRIKHKGDRLQALSDSHQTNICQNILLKQRIVQKGWLCYFYACKECGENNNKRATYQAWCSCNHTQDEKKAA